MELTPHHGEKATEASTVATMKASTPSLAEKIANDSVYAPTPDQVELTNLEDDPHRAALEDDYKRSLPAKTWAAIFFLGFTFQPALAFSVNGVFPIIAVIATDVQGSTTNSAWMSSGWTLGGTIAFSIAGRISDIFGRRYVLLFGQVTLIVSYVCAPNNYIDVSC